ncbi:MAG: DUF4350 domain-containing protein [Sedimentisphaerales bacterium]|nr:DUF4350 domain-containing protein [Sedimentisphaerales bacterium]
MSRIPILFLIVLSCASYAAGKVEFNVDFFCGWDGYYRPMEWTPVEIGITSDLTEPFAGTFTISARQDGLNTLNVVRSFVLTPDLPQNLPLVTKVAFGMGKCDLAIRDRRGRVQWDYSADIWDYSSQARLMRPIQEHDLLIGVVGQPQFGLLRLPRETASASNRGPGKVNVGRKVARVVPRDWTGFVSLDVLVLYDPDWSLLHRESLQAISEWVSNGGTLLLVLGQHPLSQDSPLAEAIPFYLGEPRERTIDTEVLADWGLNSSAAETVVAWPLFAKPDALLTKHTSAEEGGYLYGLGSVGFGRVAVLSFDPAQLSEGQAARAAAFWTSHIKACLDVPLTAAQRDTQERETRIRSQYDPFLAGRAGAVQASQVAARNGRTIVLTREGDDAEGGRNDSMYQISVAQSAANRVMEYLYELSQMKPLSIWWVILILTTLALLLGPVDYLILKRLDRLPLTWLTSTGWIVVFTVGAYYGVQALRGGRMQLRAISVLDGIADSNCAWATHYAGLFAPRSADYRLEGLGPRQWWSGIAPSQEQLYYYQRESAMRRIHCVQEDGANLPVSVPINIWTVQSLLAEMPLEKMPFTATVERDGDDLLVELTNLSDSPVRTGFVLLEEGFANLGLVHARATEQFRLRTRPFNPWGPSHQVYRGPRRAGQFPVEVASVPRYPIDLGLVGSSAFFAQGTFDRTQAMHAYLRLGAALVCVEFADAPVPFSVKDRSYDVAHIQLARQIVFPKDPQ